MAVRYLQVKAILLKEGVEEGPKEIRRFRMEEERGGQLLNSLMTRVHTVFSVDSSTQQCTLYWKDDDDDLIHFSSEDELRHAVDNMVDSTLRVYVIVSGRGSEGSSGSPPEQNAGNNKHPQPGTYFCPPPPPPPPHHPHPHGPPPFFRGPWAHGGWKKWKPMGLGGWKGGLFFGCPWAMGHDGYGYGYGPGRKGKGLFKHGWNKKMKKIMKMTRFKMADANQQKEFIEVRQQVPEEFRRWVRQYLSTWYQQGPEAALATATDQVPAGVGPEFPHWLHTFLNRHYPHPSTWETCDGETDVGREGEMGNAPQCLPPVYFRWLCLFVPRFLWRNAHLGGSATSDFEEDKNCQYPGGFCHVYSQAFGTRRGFGGPGKGRFCKKKKGGKHRCSSSSDSDSDGGQKPWYKVPRGFRKYVRMSCKQLRKGKGDNPKIKEKATRMGVPKEVQEFVDQILLEWLAKVSLQDPDVIAKEMIGTERALPSGLQRDNFVWMIRFIARWQSKAGRKGCPMSGWMSEESTSDDMSAEEATPKEQDCGACPPMPRPMYGPPFMGMMGPPPHNFPGMAHPFAPPPPPPPPPPPMFGPPPGFYPMSPPAYTFECPGQGVDYGKPCDGENKDSDADTSSTDEMVEHVTEKVKKM